MFKEKWKTISGFDKYEISNKGEIRSNRFKKTKLLKPAINESGYYRLSLTKNKKASSHLVSRLVAINFLKKIEGKDQVNHIDGDKLNNNVENLEWSTQSENTKHAYKICGHTRVQGEKSGMSKLTWKKVEKIRKSNLTQTKLAKIFNINQTSISCVILNKTWKVNNKKI